MVKQGNYSSVKEIVSANVRRNFNMSLDEFLIEGDEPYIENLDETVQLINTYLLTNETKKITIVGDYDCDGISATTIMAAAFMVRGIIPRLRIPHRFSEGYGINESIIDDIDEGLLITVDNGITAISAIKAAKEKGLTVIVTDHHLPKVDDEGNVILPEADIILDPHINRENSEFEDYCGAGIAYRVAKAMNPEKSLRTLLVLASIATVADVVPLYGANRKLLKEGLTAINERTAETVLPGLRKLMELTRLYDHINEESYGFVLAPLFNAPGRLHDNGSDMVVRLLSMGEKSPDLTALSERVFNNNNRRKELVRLAMEDLSGAIGSSGERPIVVYKEGINEGIVGLIAGRLCEMYRCPAVCLTDSNEEGMIKGSARSIPEIHVKNVLDSIQTLLVKYGGHAGAAGLTLKKENLSSFKEAFTDACLNDFEKSLPPEKREKRDEFLPWLSYEDTYDLELDISDIDNIMNELSLFAPFGEGNPAPRFYIEIDISPVEVSFLSGKHLKFIYKGLKFIGFNMVDTYKSLGQPGHFAVTGYMGENWFRGEKSYQFQIANIESFGL